MYDAHGGQTSSKSRGPVQGRYTQLVKPSSALIRFRLVRPDQLASQLIRIVGSRGS